MGRLISFRNFAALSVAASYLALGAILTGATVGGRTLNAWLSVGFILLFASISVGGVARFSLQERSNLIARILRTGVPFWVWLLGLWLVTQWTSLLRGPQTVEAIQPVMIASLFGVGLLAFFFEPRTKLPVEKVLTWAGVVGAILVHSDALLGQSMFTGRHESMFLLVGLFASLSHRGPLWWRFSSSLLILSALNLALSRTVIAIAIFAFFYFVLFGRGREILYRAVLALAAVGVMVILWLSRADLRDRFLDPGDRAFSITETDAVEVNSEPLFINSNGRLEVWTRLLEKVDATHWLLGHGAGAARAEASSEFGWDHPHSEYIRLLVDTGTAGLGLWLLFFGFLFLWVIRGTTRENLDQSFLVTGLILCFLLLGVTDLPAVSFGFNLLFILLVGNNLQDFKPQKHP